ncbi:hypothetical protein C3941_22665 [Kaistia algarum]|uniref:hypothetical protein n=1 Tax=Kaistia algarum TaxID=2083279 RepID=UPI000CE84BAE|nr:hypothetical protein [Kaistia algarum]MCX5513565.1 hypothetical protein [Kaistia algarum]PPE77662.1 hypothetical protein C3941_22665 [Kaistia algarum]
MPPSNHPPTAVMSQLDIVLRRSIAHLDPSDRIGRDRVFASARAAMIRLLHVYDPPLTSDEIASKIGEFDTIARAIEAQFLLARPAGGMLMLEAASVFEKRGPVAPLALPRPEAPLLPDPEIEEDEEEPLVDDGEAVEPAEDVDLYADYEDDDPDRDDDYYDDENDDEHVGPKDRFLDMIDAIGWRPIAVAGALLLLGAAFAWFVYARSPEPAQSASAPAVSESATPETVSEPAAPPAAQPESPPAIDAAAPRPAPTPAAALSPTGLALESLVLFDGRDPSVFQSAPENPVSFQGDAEGGFARVSSSTGSTGARVQVGRGVYQRIAGHQIRIVIVARAARTAPATTLRFAYQNGRMQSPWTDVPLTGTYTPLSAVWTAPPERGGPENDSLIIEPGIPGDDTAVDIRSVRIEILN